MNISVQDLQTLTSILNDLPIPINISLQKKQIKNVRHPLRVA